MYQGEDGTLLHTTTHNTITLVNRYTMVSTSILTMIWYGNDIQRSMRPAWYSVRQDTRMVIVREREDSEREEEEVPHARYFLLSLQQNKSRCRI